MTRSRGSTGRGHGNRQTTRTFKKCPISAAEEAAVEAVRLFPFPWVTVSELETIIYICLFGKFFPKI